jgi:hypothetical protein
LAMESLAASPFALLDRHSSLRLVTDVVHEDDALCLALTCRALRDALWARFPRRPAGDAHAGARVRTRDAAAVGTVSRLVWARRYPRRPWPGVRRDWEPWKICATAARHGALASLQRARANGYDWNAATCRVAAEGGHLAVLQWARANGCNWNANTCHGAALGGHLTVLQWARANGCDWDEFTCRMAARGGHLGVLQWVRAHGCDWNAATCSWAAAGGHLDVLKWARATGCDWHRATCLEVAPTGSETVEWIQAQPA